VTIRPGFYKTVPIFNDVSWKKSHFSRDAHLSSFWLDLPDLSQFAHLCSRMLMHWWPEISSDFICIYEEIVGGAGGAHNALPDPKVEPPTARAFGARTLRFAPSALVSDCGARIIVTLKQVYWYIVAIRLD